MTDANAAKRKLLEKDLNGIGTHNLYQITRPSTPALRVMTLQFRMK